MNCCDDRKQVVTKRVFLAVAVCCAGLLAGCSKQDEHALDNGKAIVVTRGWNNRVGTIVLRDETGKAVIRIDVEYDGEKTERVSFTDPSGKLIGETVFLSDRISSLGGPIFGELSTHSDSDGVKVKRVWTYRNEFLLYSEEFRISHDQQLLSKLVRGPYEYLLENYRSDTQETE